MNKDENKDENNHEEIKKQIEDRYKRLKRGKRRPSLEYISTGDIKDIFLPYVQNKEEFLSLSNDQIRKLYQDWFESFSKSTENELENPEIDD